MFALYCQMVRHCEPRQLVACLTNRQVRNKALQDRIAVGAFLARKYDERCSIRSRCNRHDDTVLGESVAVCTNCSAALIRNHFLFVCQSSRAEASTTVYLLHLLLLSHEDCLL